MSARPLVWVLWILSVSLGLQGCDRREPPAPPPPPLPSTDLDVGLTAAQSTLWRTTPEGSDLAPVDILRAMKDFETGRLYVDALDYYGFIPSTASAANPYGLPIGWTTHVPSYAPFQQDYVSINCAACHTGQLTYEGRAMVIDGGSNMADIEALALSIKSSAVKMLEDPIEALLFVHRLLNLEPPEGTEGQSLGAQVDDDVKAFLKTYADAVQNDVPEPEDLVARALGQAFSKLLDDNRDEGKVTQLTADVMGVVDTVEGARDEVQRLLTWVRNLKALLTNRLQLAKRALTALEISQPAGPGRDDPWGIIRNVLFASGTELDAPTSIPALYHARDFPWYHADGNTNSVMQRDIAQAVALGGFVDPDTGQSSLLPRRIWQLEEVMRTLKSPAWPADRFGQPDADKVARGQALFEQHCLGCHGSNDGKLLPLDAIGTDPNRAESFLRPQNGLPFHEALSQEVGALEQTVYTQAGIPQEEVEEHEYNGPPVWRGTGKYQSRLLNGVWSTAPYLHNGSVPTLYDLLLPADQRPATFQLGDRQYDPEKVGYVTEATDASRFTFNITTHGGANSGHEYGTDLDDEARWALVEYLKTL